MHCFKKGLKNKEEKEIKYENIVKNIISIIYDVFPGEYKIICKIMLLLLNKYNELISYFVENNYISEEEWQNLRKNIKDIEKIFVVSFSFIAQQIKESLEINLINSINFLKKNNVLNFLKYGLNDFIYIVNLFKNIDFKNINMNELLPRVKNVLFQLTGRKINSVKSIATCLYVLDIEYLSKNFIPICENLIKLSNYFCYFELSSFLKKH